jgi:hypothetical protein
VAAKGSSGLKPGRSTAASSGRSRGVTKPAGEGGGLRVGCCRLGALLTSSAGQLAVGRGATPGGCQRAEAGPTAANGGPGLGRRSFWLPPPSLPEPPPRLACFPRTEALTVNIQTHVGSVHNLGLIAEGDLLQWKCRSRRRGPLQFCFDKPDMAVQHGELGCQLTAQQESVRVCRGGGGGGQPAAVQPCPTTPFLMGLIALTTTLSPSSAGASAIKKQASVGGSGAGHPAPPCHKQHAPVPYHLDRSLRPGQGPALRTRAPGVGVVPMIDHIHVGQQVGGHLLGGAVSVEAKVAGADLRAASGAGGAHSFDRAVDGLAWLTVERQSGSQHCC